jgi:hypothetical protein
MRRDSIILSQCYLLETDGDDRGVLFESDFRLHSTKRRREQSMTRVGDAEFFFTKNSPKMCENYS